MVRRRWRLRPGADGGSAITNYEYSVDGGVTWIAAGTGCHVSPLMITGFVERDVLSGGDQGGECGWCGCVVGSGGVGDSAHDPGCPDRFGGDAW